MALSAGSVAGGRGSTGHQEVAAAAYPPEPWDLHRPRPGRDPVLPRDFAPPPHSPRTRAVSVLGRVHELRSFRLIVGRR